MNSLSRRRFLAIAGGLGVAWALPTDIVAGLLAQEAQPAEVETTLVATIRKNFGENSFYKTLSAAPGEPFVVREDVLSKAPATARTSTRRSLLYIGQLSDFQIVDTQSPARAEFVQQLTLDLSTYAACRPQETLVTHVITQMVRAMNKALSSPVTGAPMALTLVTGDQCDGRAKTELGWAVDILDGKPFKPNSGKPGVYQGVQAWGEATYAYHPDDPSSDIYGKHDFPAFPGLLDAAVSTEAGTAGLRVPWYAMFGNHDTIYIGVAPKSWVEHQLARGKRKFSRFVPNVPAALGAAGANSVLERQLASAAFDNAIGVPGLRSVPSDSKRDQFDNEEFIRAHLDSPAVPGPVGHGFTEHDLDSGRTYWARDFAPGFRVIAMNTCNQTAGPDGSVPEDQFRWLENQMQGASSRYLDASGTLQTHGVDDRLIIVTSHHNSYTMDNTVAATIEKPEKLYTGDEVVELLLRYPNCVAWVNGHTHFNQVRAHVNARLNDGSGFWEINAASCADWAQQQRLIEFVDNRDGTLSIFTIVLDHDSPVTPDKNDFSSAGLASIARELSANHWFAVPDERLGSRYDRNVELPLKAPFDLSTISDAALEAAQAKSRALALRGGTGDGS